MVAGSLQDEDNVRDSRHVVCLYQAETATLKKPLRSSVADVGIREQRPCQLKSQELPERLGADTTTPEFLAEPVADAATIVLPPRHDVSGDPAASVHRPGQHLGIGQDLATPMRDKLSPGPLGAIRSAVGLRILLLNEEDVDVVLLDHAEKDA